MAATLDEVKNQLDKIEQSLNSLSGNTKGGFTIKTQGLEDALNNIADRLSTTGQSTGGVTHSKGNTNTPNFRSIGDILSNIESKLDKFSNKGASKNAISSSNIANLNAAINDAAKYLRSISEHLSNTPSQSADISASNGTLTGNTTIESTAENILDELKQIRLNGIGKGAAATSSNNKNDIISDLQKEIISIKDDNPTLSKTVKNEPLTERDKIRSEKNRNNIGREPGEEQSTGERIADSISNAISNFVSDKPTASNTADSLKKYCYFIKPSWFCD